MNIVQKKERLTHVYPHMFGPNTIVFPYSSYLLPLQTFVLQYRALQNVLSKWLEPEWMGPLMVRSGASEGLDADACAGVWGPPPLPRLSCSWNQTSTATGRLSSSAPNLQV